MKPAPRLDFVSIGIAILFSLFAGSLIWSLYWLWLLTDAMPRGVWLG